MDDGKLVKNPLGLSSEFISAKIVTTSVPRKNLYNLLNVFQLCNIEVIDITFKAIADYFEVKSRKTNNK